MLFKQLNIYKFEGDVPLNDQLKELLEKFKYRECLPNEEIQSGWTSPIDDSDEGFSYHIMQTSMICLKIEEKKIPASVIKEELKKRVDKEKAKNPDLKKISRALQQQLKEEIRQELLPKTLSKITRIKAVIDYRDSIILIETPNNNKAESFLFQLKTAIGENALFTPLRTRNNPGSSMTNWVLSNQMPGNFSYGEECALNNKEGNNKISYKNHNLEDQFLRTYLEDGFEIDEMAIHWKEHHGFVLTNDLIIKKIKEDTELLEQLDSDAESMSEHFNNLMQVQITMWRTWLPELWNTLGGIEE